MKEYYNHICLWLKTNRPRYVLVLIKYSSGISEWLLEDVEVLDDRTILLDGIPFKNYVDVVFGDASCKFYKFEKPGEKEEL